VEEQSQGDYRKTLGGLNDGPRVSSSDSPRPSGEDSPRISISEPVRATLLSVADDSTVRRSSFESRRSSFEVRGRMSTDVNERRRGRTSRSRSIKSPTRNESMESDNLESYDTTRDSSMAGIQSIDESQVSSSQVLKSSDVFRAPTSHALGGSPDSFEHRNSTSTAIPPRPSSSRSRQHSGTRSSSKQRHDSANIASSSKTPAMQSSSTIESLMKAGSYNFNRATGLASAVRESSRRMSTQLQAQSMDYFEKISGMWNAPTRHYGPVEGMPPDDDVGDNELDNEFHSERFRQHFALPDSEELVATYFAYFWRVLPLYGKIYISKNFFCFRSLLVGTRCKLIVPIRDIENASKHKSGYRQKYDSLVLTIRGHEEIFFDFSKQSARDDCTIVVLLSLEAQKKEQGLKASGEAQSSAIEEYKSLRESRQDGQPEHDIELPKNLNVVPGLDAPPILFDDPKASILNFKPPKPMRVTCLTIGSRGDVQPYIALAKGLMADGHKVKIATHSEFESWIRSHGIEFAPVSGDPGELMRICIQYGMFTVSFLKEAHGKVRLGARSL